MAKSKHYYIRRTHRYLGLILGIQFFFWTVGGLYFSWTNIDEIHGDLQHKHPPHLPGNPNLISPSMAMQKTGLPVDSLHAVQLVTVLGKPFYQLQFFSGGRLRKVLTDAVTGVAKGVMTQEEAIRIAAESFNGDPKLQAAQYITTTHGHHEYREKPLPAWAVTFKHPTNTTVYVGAETGKVESFRNNKWRIFDFLWMGHTMDYQGRDNINNWLLRIFSVFGLITILSGFALYWVSSKSVRRLRAVRR